MLCLLKFMVLALKRSSFTSTTGGIGPAIKKPKGMKLYYIEGSCIHLLLCENTFLVSSSSTPREVKNVFTAMTSHSLVMHHLYQRWDGIPLVICEVQPSPHSETIRKLCLPWTCVHLSNLSNNWLNYYSCC